MINQHTPGLHRAGVFASLDGNGNDGLSDLLACFGSTSFSWSRPDLPFEIPLSSDPLLANRVCRTYAGVRRTFHGNAVDMGARQPTAYPQQALCEPDGSSYVHRECLTAFGRCEPTEVSCGLFRWHLPDPEAPPKDWPCVLQDRVGVP